MLLHEGILHIHLTAHADITLNNAIQAVVKMGELSKGKKLPVFIDTGDFCTIDSEARQFRQAQKVIFTP